MENAKPTDDEILRKWTLAQRLCTRGTPLSLRLADALVDRLEACGVTEDDLDRAMAKPEAEQGRGLSLASETLQPAWTAVKDEVPSFWVPLWLSSPTLGYFTGYSSITGYRNLNDCGKVVKDVTHWMPLPKTPAASLTADGSINFEQVGPSGRLPWQVRVLEERDQLDQKLVKLTEFLIDMTPRAIPESLTLLVAQHRAMHEYRDILDQRIALF